MRTSEMNLEAQVFVVIEAASNSQRVRNWEIMFDVRSGFTRNDWMDAGDLNWTHPL